MAGYEYLNDSDTVVMYYSDENSAISKGVVDDLKTRGVNVRMVKLLKQHSNALDMYIASTTGMFLDTGEKICIVSKDKGYSAVKDFWHSLRNAEILLGETIEECFLNAVGNDDERIRNAKERNQKVLLTDSFETMNKIPTRPTLSRQNMRRRRNPSLDTTRNLEPVEILPNPLWNPGQQDNHGSVSENDGYDEDNHYIAAPGGRRQEPPASSSLSSSASGEAGGAGGYHAAMQSKGVSTVSENAGRLESATNGRSLERSKAISTEGSGGNSNIPSNQDAGRSRINQPREELNAAGMADRRNRRDDARHFANDRRHRDSRRAGFPGTDTDEEFGSRITDKGRGDKDGDITFDSNINSGINGSINSNINGNSNSNINGTINININSSKDGDFQGVSNLPEGRRGEEAERMSYPGTQGKDVAADGSDSSGQKGALSRPALNKGAAEDGQSARGKNVNSGEDGGRQSVQKPESGRTLSEAADASFANHVGQAGRSDAAYTGSSGKGGTSVWINSSSRLSSVTRLIPRINPNQVQFVYDPATGKMKKVGDTAEDSAVHADQAGQADDAGHEGNSNNANRADQVNQEDRANRADQINQENRADRADQVNQEDRANRADQVNQENRADQEDQANHKDGTDRIIDTGNKDHSDTIDAVDSGHRGKMTDLIDNVDRVDHVNNADHADNADNADNVNRVDNINNADHVDNTDLIDHVDNSGPIDHVDSTDSIDHDDNADHVSYIVHADDVANEAGSVELAGESSRKEGASPIGNSGDQGNNSNDSAFDEKANLSGQAFPAAVVPLPGQIGDAAAYGPNSEDEKEAGSGNLEFPLENEDDSEPNAESGLLNNDSEDIEGQLPVSSENIVGQIPVSFENVEGQLPVSDEDGHQAFSDGALGMTEDHGESESDNPSGMGVAAEKDNAAEMAKNIYPDDILSGEMSLSDASVGNGHVVSEESSAETLANSIGDLNFDEGRGDPVQEVLPGIMDVEGDDEGNDSDAVSTFETPLESEPAGNASSENLAVNPSRTSRSRRKAQLNSKGGPSQAKDEKKRGKTRKKTSKAENVVEAANDGAAGMTDSNEEQNSAKTTVQEGREAEPSQTVQFDPEDFFRKYSAGVNTVHQYYLKIMKTFGRAEGRVLYDWTKKLMQAEVKRKKAEKAQTQDAGDENEGTEQQNESGISV